MSPKVRAAGIVTRVVPGMHESGGDELQVMVQCDAAETFYRFPGGTVEYGETAAQTIERELMEEYRLRIRVGELLVVNEHFFQYHGKENHHVTLLHRCELAESRKPDEVLWHSEHETVKLVWRSLRQLRNRPLYPEGVLALLEEEAQSRLHLITGKKTHPDHQTGCPLCYPALDGRQRIMLQNRHCIYLSRAGDEKRGEGILVPRRHRATAFDLNEAEWTAVHRLLGAVKKETERNHFPTGYQLTWHDETSPDSAGGHAYLHVAPRYADDPGDADPDHRAGVSAESADRDSNRRNQERSRHRRGKGKRH